MRAFPWIKNGVGVAGLLLAVLLVGYWAMRGTGVEWQPYSERLLEQAREQDKPVIIDFYATWCAACRPSSLSALKAGNARTCGWWTFWSPRPLPGAWINC
nr:thioredoxin family protein [Desulfonatronum thioautotrophicum]